MCSKLSPGIPSRNVQFFLIKKRECKSPCKAAGFRNTWGYRESQMQGIIVNNVDGDARDTAREV